MMIDMKFYPIDVDKLNKGDYISPEQIEKIYGIQQKNREFPQKVLELREFIRFESRQKDRPLHTKIEKDGVRILDDQEDVDYTEKKYSHGRRKMMSALADEMEIDRTNLDTTTQNKLERNIICQSMELQAMRKARRRIITEYKRKDPLLNGKVGETTNASGNDTGAADTDTGNDTDVDKETKD